MIALPPSLCTGTVFHRRAHPTVHEFAYPVSYVLFDPDQPRTVADEHPLWSATHPAPARFRRGDALCRKARKAEQGQRAVDALLELVADRVDALAPADHRRCGHQRNTDGTSGQHSFRQGQENQGHEQRDRPMAPPGCQVLSHQALTDQQLRDKTTEFRTCVAGGESLDQRCDLLCLGHAHGGKDAATG